MDYWKFESGVFAFILCVISTGAVKCYLHRTTNDTEETLGHWMYCVTGCCHDHCCAEKNINNTDSTETMAMVFVGLFVLGTLFIILSWTNVGKAIRHFCQKRRAEDLTPMAISEENLPKTPTKSEPLLLTKAIRHVIHKTVYRKDKISHQDNRDCAQRPLHPANSIPLSFSPQTSGGGEVDGRGNEPSTTNESSEKKFLGINTEV